MPPEVAHDGFDVIGDFQQVGFRAGEFESAHVAQLVGRREERGEEFYAVLPGGIECFVVKREIPRSVRAQHVRPEHPDACRFESVLREYPEEPVDLLVGLPRFDEHLRPDLRVFGALRVKGWHRNPNASNRIIFFMGYRLLQSLRPLRIASDSLLQGSSVNL